MKFSLLAPAAFAAFAGLALSASAQTHHYQILDIGVLSGQADSIGLGINASGAVVGRSGSRAFVYRNCRISDLGLLPNGTSALANAINNNGEIAGQAVGSDHGTHAVSWHDGSIHLLQPGLTYQSQAIAINGPGKVAGYEYNGQVAYATAYENDLNVVVNSDNDATYGWGSVTVATGINSSNQLVGYRNIFNSPQNQFIAQLGVVTPPGSELWTRINGPTGFTNYVTAWAINEGGATAGWAQGAGFDTRAFLSTSPSSAAKNLGTLGGTLSQAFGLNNARWVVGKSTTATNATVAFLYDGVSMVNLNTTLVNGSGWTLISASAINDYNQITGVGVHNGQSRGFLLLPVATAQPILIPPCSIIVSQPIALQ